MAYSPYLPLESEASGGENGTQAKEPFMHACVCSNHPISPLIIVQSSNLSLYSMFALLHGETPQVLLKNVPRSPWVT